MNTNQKRPRTSWLLRRVAARCPTLSSRITGVVSDQRVYSHTPGITSRPAAMVVPDGVHLAHAPAHSRPALGTGQTRRFAPPSHRAPVANRYTWHAGLGYQRSTKTRRSCGCRPRTPGENAGLRRGIAEERSATPPRGVPPSHRPQPPRGTAAHNPRTSLPGRGRGRRAAPSDLRSRASPRRRGAPRCRSRGRSRSSSSPLT
jgi:hypothetical protein